jgi:type II secretory pathway pseudopilin PulG
MRKQCGFTLIEVILFIMVMAIMAKVILLPIVEVNSGTPTSLRNLTAMQSANKCIEWFIGQRRLIGYSTVTCPSSTVPGFCSVPTGYTLAVNIVCTTINTDANYKTVTVTVGGLGNASSSLLLANY